MKCPRCGSTNIQVIGKTDSNRFRLQCQDCGKRFTRTVIDVKCPRCGSNDVVKKGHNRYQCKNCGCNFTMNLTKNKTMPEVNKLEKLNDDKVRYIISPDSITLARSDSQFVIGRSLLGDKLFDKVTNVLKDPNQNSKFNNLFKCLVNNTINFQKALYILGGESSYINQTSISSSVTKTTLSDIILDGNSIILKDSFNNKINISDNYFASLIVKLFFESLVYDSIDKKYFIALVTFFQKLLNNPDRYIFNELGLFMETGHIPITLSGDIVAYKRVRSDYKSIYDGKTDNSIGKSVSISRNFVDSNRKKTCSRGLHACSYSYLDYYIHSDNDRIILVKINPADVVSIPDDGNLKIRCCHYIPIADVTDKARQEDFLKDMGLFTLDKIKQQ